MSGQAPLVFIMAAGLGTRMKSDTATNEPSQRDVLFMSLIRLQLRDLFFEMRRLVNNRGKDCLE